MTTCLTLSDLLASIKQYYCKVTQLTQPAIVPNIYYVIFARHMGLHLCVLNGQCFLGCLYFVN